jgi:hypothetical protein
MMRDSDEIDISILDSIKKTPGISISDAIKPLLPLRSESVLRGRVRALAIKNEIRLARTKHVVKCYRNPAAEDESNG